jgi:hypothetical protein
MTEYTTSADQGVWPSDDQELKALFQRVCQAWTDGDAAAYAACFTADCDYVSFDGTRAHGREQVIESHDKLFRGVLFGSALVGEVEPFATSPTTWPCCTAAVRCLLLGARNCRSDGSPAIRWSPSEAPKAGGSPPSITVAYAPCRSQSPTLFPHDLPAAWLHLLPRRASVGQQRAPMRHL